MKSIRVGVMGLVLASGAATGQAIHPPSYYERPEDTKISTDPVVQLSVWKGRPAWWAYGECAAFVKNVRGHGSDKAKTDSLYFLFAMGDWLFKDRDIDADGVTALTSETVDGVMTQRIGAWSSSVGEDTVIESCSELIRAYPDPDQ
jgi:hypothetical protein